MQVTRERFALDQCSAGARHKYKDPGQNDRDHLALLNAAQVLPAKVSE